MPLSRPRVSFGPASSGRPGRNHGKIALVTGVGRARSIGAGLALGLAADGWDLALSHWQPYDDRLGYERGQDDRQLSRTGAGPWAAR